MVVLALPEARSEAPARSWEALTALATRPAPIWASAIFWVRWEAPAPAPMSTPLWPRSAGVTVFRLLKPVLTWRRARMSVGWTTKAGAPWVKAWGPHKATPKAPFTAAALMLAMLFAWLHSPSRRNWGFALPR